MRVDGWAGRRQAIEAWAMVRIPARREMSGYGERGELSKSYA